MKMSAKSNKRRKLQTTLGKAAEVPKNEEDDVDLAHLRKPIGTSIFGLREVLSLLQTATEEVKHYVTHECDVMYECRICRTIFRSLANFILHKRSYCRENYNATNRKNCMNNDQENGYYVTNRKDVNENLEELLPHNSPPKLRDTKKNISSVLQKLLKKQEENKAITEIANQDLSKEAEKTYEEVDDKNNVAIEEIESTDAGVFQTMFKNMAEEHGMKAEVMELHGMFSRDEAVLGPDGRVLPFETEKTVQANPLLPKCDLICTVCNQKFSTSKTLTYHIKYKHNCTRMVYPCPLCKDQFANAWCVFRHLYKVHRKSSAQIRKMRDHIHASAFRKDQEPVVKRESEVVALTNGNTNSENQWMENIEGDNDLQMCSGCGKRFERKAALHSHSQLCMKRIALCNSIKENNTKQALEEAKIQKQAKNTKNFSKSLKGSEKRKPILLRRKFERKGNCDVVCEKKCEGQNDADREKTEDVESKLNVLCEKKLDTTNVSENNKGHDKELEEVASDDMNTLDDVVLVETVTIDPSRGIETNCGLLPIENEDVSVFRTSMSPVDVCNIIGVPVLKQEPSVIQSDNESPKEQDSRCSSAQLIQDENASSRVDIEIENAIKEISSLCRTAHNRNPIEASYQKRPMPGSTEELRKTPKIEEITLESKAHKHMDKQKRLCLDCNVSFGWLSDLMEHMSKHFNWYCYQCRMCSYMSYYERTCLQHVRNEHISENGSLENTVLPVPNWKSAELSTDFVPKMKDSVEITDDDSTTREMIMEVIFGNAGDASNQQSAMQDTSKLVSEQQDSRPVRNRVKSVRMIQEDFLYDLDINSKKTLKGADGNHFVQKGKALKVYIKKANTVKKESREVIDLTEND